MNIKKYIKTSREEIEKELKSVLSMLGTSPKLHKEQKLFAERLQGGKYIRGTMVKLGYHIAGGKDNSSLIKIAAAFEILHASFLIHDDIIDKSTFRRGKLTLYKALGGEHYGVSQAICFGDLGFFLAAKLIAKSDFPRHIKSKAFTLFYEIAIDTIFGQMMDIKLSQPGQKKKEEDVLLIHAHKTAYYTISGPLMIGACVGGASDSILSRLHEFGENVGIAFQLYDDILGVFGDEKIIGKSTSDIEENKNTLLIAYALKKATPEQRKVLNSYYGKGTITSLQKKKIKQVFIDTGSLDYSYRLIDEYIAKGRAMIPTITKNKDLQQYMYAIIDFIINRKN